MVGLSESGIQNPNSSVTKWSETLKISNTYSQMLFPYMQVIFFKSY